MATRSFIATYNGDTHEYTAIYCHWDGYPEGVGATLRDHYTSSGQIDTLLTYGDISSLRDTLFDTQSERYKLRGDTDVDARTFRFLYEMTDYYRGCGCEYGYIWRGDRWECLKLDPQEINLYELESANV